MEEKTSMNPAEAEETRLRRLEYQAMVMTAASKNCEIEVALMSPTKEIAWVRKLDADPFNWGSNLYRVKYPEYYPLPRPDYQQDRLWVSVFLSNRSELMSYMAEAEQLLTAYEDDPIPADVRNKVRYLLAEACYYL